MAESAFDPFADEVQAEDTPEVAAVEETAPEAPEEASVDVAEDQASVVLAQDFDAGTYVDENDTEVANERVAHVSVAGCPDRVEVSDDPTQVDQGCAQELVATPFVEAAE